MPLSDKVNANPNGLQVSCALMVSGLPYLWDDGLADWSGITAALTTGDADKTYTVKVGGLAGRPTAFTQQSSPLEPLTTGSGATFKLRDDGSRYLAKLFAVNNRGTVSTRLAANQTSSSTSETWTVQSITGISANDVLYCGLETLVVNGAPAGVSVAVSRGCFGSKRHPHMGTQVTTSNQYTGPRLTSSPTVFKGRFAQLLVAYVSEGGVVTQYDVVWQGLVGKVGNEGPFISITCDPISDQVKKTEWPVQLAKGTVRGVDNATVRIDANPDRWMLDIEVTNVDDPSVKYRDFVPLVTYSAGSGTPSQVTVAAGVYTAAQVYGWIRDTILYNVRTALASALVPGVTNDFEPNRFTIDITSEDGVIKVFYTNKTRFDVFIGAQRGFGQWAAIGSERGLFPKFGNGGGIANLGYTFYHDMFGQPIRTFAIKTALIAKSDDTILVTLDNANNCFDTLSGYDGSSVVGYASISQGDEKEIISFTTVTVDATDKTKVTLTGVLRGRAGTLNRAWEAGSAQVVVQQIVMLEAVNVSSFKAHEVLLTILGSTGIGAGVSTYDRLGWRYSPGLTNMQIDRGGIVQRLQAVGDIPEPQVFYIDEQGGGDKAVEAFCKMCGIYFTSRRYGGAGPVPDTFGMSVDVVDAPVQTMYGQVCTDADRSAQEAPKTDFNERLLINQFSYVPRLTFMSDDAFAADDNNPYRKWDKLKAVNVYAEDSISDYGIGQSLDIKDSTFLFSTALHLEDVDTAREAAAAWATVSALRWFSSFANGNYLLTVKVISPRGWRYQVGDRVRCRFSGVTGPDGSADLDVVGKAMKVEHRFNDGCMLELRLNYSPEGAELCPVATCLAHTAGNGITLSTITWCDPDSSGDAVNPFPDNAESAKDWMWFDPSNHTGADGLQVHIWRADSWSAREQKQITALDKGTGKITLNAALGATLQADITALAVPVYVSFFTYAQLSPLRKLYAYVADMSYLLGAANDAAKEYT